jgi:PhnB protein
MPKLEPYLVFDGNAGDAMRFYQQILGGTMQTFMTHGESPMAAQTPTEAHDRIMHAHLVLADGRAIMASDAMMDKPYPGMHSFSLSLVYPTVTEAKKIFDALADGGRITMPFQKSFWAEAFGMVRDRFGTAWMVSGEK